MTGPGPASFAGRREALLRDRGVPSHVLPDSTGCLADALEAETPAVARLVADSSRRTA